LRTKCDLTALAVKNGIEVLVKAEHDFYREKWQKEKDVTSLAVGPYFANSCHSSL
jgi:hypothetical protein